MVEDLDAAEIRGWAVGLSALHQRVARHFVRAEPRQLAYDSVRALISPIERKHGWHSAAHIGTTAPDDVHRVRATAHWDADQVRDDLQAYGVEHLGHPGPYRSEDQTFGQLGAVTSVERPMITAQTGSVVDAWAAPVRHGCVTDP